jgi:O-antigen/teichoic acid export membrane protein
LAAIFLQVVNLIVNFILPQVMIRQYGSAMNGLVSSTRQIISYFNIVEAGLMGAVVYALYKPLADKNDDEVNGIISASNRFYNISGFIFSALVLASTFIYPLFLTNQKISPFVISALVAIIGTSGALEFFFVGKYKVLFTADQKSYVISFINAVAIVVNALIIIVMAAFHVDMVMVQFAALLSFVLRSTLYTAYGRKRYKHLNFKVPPNNKALDKRWDSFALQLLGLATTATPIIVITVFCGFDEVSVFTVFNMVFVSVLALLSTFNSGLSAMFGDLLARNELKTIQRAYHQYEFMYYGLMTWGYACAAILIMPFMSLYVKRFPDAAIYIRPEIASLFVVVGILSNIKTPQGMLVISAGLYKETKPQTLIQALIGVILSVLFAVLLSPDYGIVGVLIGAAAANLYRDIDLIFYIPKTVTKLSPVMTLRRVGRMFVLFGIAVLPITVFIPYQPNNYFQWLILAILSSVWAFLVIVIGNILMEIQTTKDTLSRFKNVFSKQ